MKTVRDTLLDRRSIRRYEREQIKPEDIQFIHNAILNTPTSYNGQQFTVIDISSQSLKEKLYELTGQKQIKTCSHFMVFCADYHRIRVAAKAREIPWPEFNNTADGLIVGTVDATLALMSALVAAESLGLGCCPIGYVRTADPEGISSLLKLPKDVFAVCGLAIGIPREMPDMKPKMSEPLIIHHDTYRNDEGVMVAEVEQYDNEIAEYTAHRSGNVKVHAWLDNILSYYREALSFDMLDHLRKRGFNIEK